MKCNATWNGEECAAIAGHSTDHLHQSGRTTMVSWIDSDPGAKPHMDPQPVNTIDFRGIQQPAGEWLDKPTHDGWWWRASSVMEAGIVIGDKWYGSCEEWRSGIAFGDGLRWKAASLPAHPPKQLPTSKQVTITAKVKLNVLGKWCVSRYFNNALDNIVGFDSEHDALRYCRDMHGIEPEVVA